MQNEGQGYVPNVPEPPEIKPRGYTLAVIKGDLPNAINAGLNQTQAFNAYVEAGLGANYPAFRALYNETKAQMASRLAENPNGAIGVPLTSDATDWQREALAGKSYYRYKEVFETSVFDNTTGEIQTQTLAYYHNEPMTVGELQAEALSFFQGEGMPSGYPKYVLSASLERSFVNSNFVTQVEK